MNGGGPDQRFVEYDPGARTIDKGRWLEIAGVKTFALKTLSRKRLTLIISLQ